MAFPDSLKMLLNAVVASREIHEQAAKDATGNLASGLFRQMWKLRVEVEAEIRHALETVGGIVDESPSLTSSLHRTAITVRAAVIGLDAQALPSFVEGEQRILVQYQAAIDECRAHPRIVRMLVAQKSQLENMIARMNDLIAGSRTALV